MSVILTRLDCTKLAATVGDLEGRLSDEHNSLIGCWNTKKLLLLELSFHKLYDGMKFDLQI